MGVTLPPEHPDVATDGRKRAGLGIGAPQLFDPFAAIMLLGLTAILCGDTADLPNGLQRYPRDLEARVARALVTGVAGGSDVR
ncbi:MAG: hypothetical protein ACRDWA_07980 [Acidimicrobiia bacterium]